MTRIFELHQFWKKKLLFPPKGTICPRKRTYRFTLNYCVFAAQQRSTKETENVIERDVICPCLARTFNRSSLFLKLANIYSLLERLKMILHKLITIGLSSCEISARDYSHRPWPSWSHPTKGPKATSSHRWPSFPSQSPVVVTARNSFFVTLCRRPIEPWSYLWVCTTLPGADNLIGSWCDQSTLPWKLFRTTKSLLCEPSDVSFLVAR